MWEIWRTITETGNTGLAAVPVGGVTNVFTTNQHGNGKYTRDLSGCPMTVITEDGATMAFIDVVYHTDGSVFGALPGLGGTTANFIGDDGERYQSTLPVGTNSNTHMTFPLLVDEL
jgi:hypothetical protein